LDEGLKNLGPTGVTNRSDAPPSALLRRGPLQINMQKLVAHSPVLVRRKQKTQRLQ